MSSASSQKSLGHIVFWYVVKPYREYMPDENNTNDLCRATTRVLSVFVYKCSTESGSGLHEPAAGDLWLRT